MKKVVMILVVLLIISNGCIYQSDRRPNFNEEEVWICESPHIELYWNNPNDKIYKGLIKTENCSYEVFHVENPGSTVYMYSTDGAKFEDDFKELDKYLLFKSRANYNYDTFTLQVEEDRVNMFDGELPLLKFKCYKKSEYFKDKQNDK